MPAWAGLWRQTSSSPGGLAAPELRKCHRLLVLLACWLLGGRLSGLPSCSSKLPESPDRSLTTNNACHPWSFVALLAQLEPAQMHNMTSQPVDHLALSIPTFTISSNPSPIQIYIESLLCTGIAYPCQDLGVSITHFNCVVHSGLSQTWQSKPMAELFGYPGKIVQSSFSWTRTLIANSSTSQGVLLSGVGGCGNDSSPLSF